MPWQSSCWACTLALTCAGWAVVPGLSRVPLHGLQPALKNYLNYKQEYILQNGSWWVLSQGRQNFLIVRCVENPSIDPGNCLHWVWPNSSTLDQGGIGWNYQSFRVQANKYLPWELKNLLFLPDSAPKLIGANGSRCCLHWKELWCSSIYFWEARLHADR